MNNFVDKPHMRREEWVSWNVIFGRKVYHWVCIGELTTGIGDTPREAYFDWLIKLRLHLPYTPDPGILVRDTREERALFSNMDKWRCNHNSYKKFECVNRKGFATDPPGIIERLLKWVDSACKRFKCL